MSYKVVISSEFAKEAKRIAKKHIGIKSDIAKLIADLAINPTIGIELGRNFYKIRMSISGTNKGKSGGARIITYVILNEETVLLTEIYLKSEHDTADTTVLIQRLKDQGLIWTPFLSNGVFLQSQTLLFIEGRKRFFYSYSNLFKI